MMHHWCPHVGRSGQLAVSGASSTGSRSSV
jgi:hypothetical protein